MYSTYLKNWYKKKLKNDIFKLWQFKISQYITVTFFGIKIENNT